jgi:putative ATP-binding cassette transporter
VLAALFEVTSGTASMGLIWQINRALSRGANASTLKWFLVLCFARLVFGLCGHLLFDWLGHRTIYDLRLRLCQGILALPLRKLEQLGPSKLLAAFTQDVLALARSGHMVASVVMHCAFVIACAAYFATLSIPGLGVVVVILVGGLTVAGMLSSRAEKLMTMAREDQDALFGGFRGITAGGKELKLHAARRAEFVAQSLEVPSVAYRSKLGRSAVLGFLASQWQSLLFLVLVGVLLFETPRMHILDARVLGSCVLAVLFMQSSIHNLLMAYPSLQASGVALAKLDSLGLSVSLVATEVAGETSPRPTGSTIELRGVVHEYRGDEDDTVFSLGPIDLALHPGEIVFIVGGNGSGKSTLVKVLTGLYVPQSGEIQVDGRVVDDSTREGYRQLFSAVFSDWYLFDRLYGLEAAAVGDDARRYLEELRLEKKVSLKDGTFSTTALSQGQRKRLMMLTAYLEDRPVYVFDEWASDQDPIFKQFFYNDILKRLKERGKTVVVVSHDDTYFASADRLIRLESGALVPAGAS